MSHEYDMGIVVRVCERKEKVNCTGILSALYVRDDTGKIFKNSSHTAYIRDGYKRSVSRDNLTTHGLW